MAIDPDVLIPAALHEPATNEVFAAIVGISDARGSQLKAEGVLPEQGGSLLQWLRAYIARLREVAAGRYSEGPLDLGQERAALARSQREGIEIKNAVLRGEFARIELLTQVLATASQAVSDRFDHLPAMVRRACPTLPEAALRPVLTVIAAARDEWVRSTVELVARDLAADDDEDGDDAGAG
jgi:phage terminase Nu1 subunit (DNA packaging protein)